jgi:hypothetical protein
MCLKAASSDIITVAELTQQLFTQAEAAGVSNEMEEEVGSVYQAISLRSCTMKLAWLTE